MYFCLEFNGKLRRRIKENIFRFFKFQTSFRKYKPRPATQRLRGVAVCNAKLIPKETEQKDSDYPLPPRISDIDFEIGFKLAVFNRNGLFARF